MEMEPIVPRLPAFLMPVTLKVKFVLDAIDVSVKVFIRISLVDELAVHE